jgi:hypothetical protein
LLAPARRSQLTSGDDPSRPHPRAIPRWGFLPRRTAFGPELTGPRQCGRNTGAGAPLPRV